MIPLHLHRIQDINTWSSKLEPHDVGSYTIPCSTPYHQSVQRTTPASRRIPALVLQLNYHWWALGTQSPSKFKVPSFPSSFHILCCAALRRVKALFLRCSGTQLTQMLAQVPWGTGYVPTDLDMVLWNICPMHVGTPSFSHNHPSPRFILFLEALFAKLPLTSWVSAWKSVLLLLLSYFSHWLYVLTFTMTQSIRSLYNQWAQSFFKMVSHSIKVRCPRSVWISVSVLCLRASKQFCKGWPSNIL